MQIIKKILHQWVSWGYCPWTCMKKYRRVNKRKSDAFLNRTEEQRVSIPRVEIFAFLCYILLFSGGINIFSLQYSGNNTVYNVWIKTEAQCPTPIRMAQQREKMELHLQRFRRHYWDNFVLCASFWQFLIKMISIVSSTFLRTFWSFTLKLLESILYFLKYFFHI